MKEKNFGLTEEEFFSLVSDLKKNELTFFEQVFLKQFKETMLYVERNFKATSQDAYDATMDALLEFRQRFVQGKLSYGNLRFLFTRMATQIYLRGRKNLGEDWETLDRLPQQEVGQSKPVDNGFGKAWNQLNADCKQLLTLHYYGKMKLTEIANDTDQKPATLRKQKERCIGKLRALLKERH